MRKDNTFLENSPQNPTKNRYYVINEGKKLAGPNTRSNFATKKHALRRDLNGFSLSAFRQKYSPPNPIDNYIMGPFKAIATCLRKYACPKGRARRSEFWWFFCFFLLFCIVAGFALGIASVKYTVIDDYLPYISSAVPALFVLPVVGVSIRRAHDTGRSGWMMLIPVYNIIILFMGSDPDDNLWGPSHLSEGIEGEEYENDYQYPADWGPFIVMSVVGLLALGSQTYEEIKNPSYQYDSNFNTIELYDYDLE